MDRREQIKSKLGELMIEVRDLETELQDLPATLPDLDTPKSIKEAVEVEVKPKAAPKVVRSKGRKKSK